MDPRDRELSDLLINYSVDLQKGEKVLIDYTGTACKPLVKQLIRDAYSKGAAPYILASDREIEREILMSCNEEQMQHMCDYMMKQMEGMDAYIAIRCDSNSTEFADVPAENMNIYNKILQPVLDYRVNKTKWSLLRYPNPSIAQMSNMSTDAFTDFYYNVCTLDYKKMSRAMDPLKELMDKTDKVEIKGPDTHLTFSIKGINSVKCDGRFNIPDGEVYTAPVKMSVNGYISYNTVSLEDGFTFENIRFEIKDGRIVRASANDTERVNALLDTDDGARYFGEFAIGVNPYVLHPMRDTLFDEKIAGSFHLTPGMCYDDADNGNKSAVHWDLVQIQRPEYGGGEIWFDDRLIRKDGLFVVPELQGLNPENLK